MSTLQHALEEALRDTSYEAFARLIAQKLEVQGVRLGDRDYRRLVEHLRDDRLEQFEFNRWRWWNRSRVTIDISSEEIEQLSTDITRLLNDGLADLIQSTAADLADGVLETLRRSWRAELRRQDRELKRFRANLQEHWGPAIAELRLFLTVARELGECVLASIDPDAESTQQYSIYAQSRLHARACQLGDEIVCLLMAGHADGALARWRTLHEVAVVALLLSEHGEELAERYVEHQAVESWKAAREFQVRCTSLGYEPLTESELKELEDGYDEAVRKYGSPFRSQYGWAADVLGSSQPTFAALEEAAGIGHLRSHYRMASHQVHSNIKGLLVKLGLIPEMDVLLTGPSNLGLADPGHSAAVSLLQVSSALVTISPSLDGLVGMEILRRQEDTVGAVFMGAHDRLLEDKDG